MEVHRDEKSLKAKELQNGTKTSTSDTKKPLNLYVPSIYFLDVPTSYDRWQDSQFFICLSKPLRYLSATGLF